jgi:hypothetical protein
LNAPFLNSLRMPELSFVSTGFRECIETPNDNLYGRLQVCMRREPFTTGKAFQVIMDRD